jgi:phosphoglycerate dehydrogenase-like enzyme
MSKVVCVSLNAEEGPHFEILKAAGFEPEVVDRSLDLSDEETAIGALNGAVAVIAGAEPYTRKVIEGLPELRVIARTGVGFDAVDLKTCDERRIVVTTTPGVNHHSVAEHTLALLFGVARGFPQTDQAVRTGKWKRIARPRVMGRTIGIVGLGRIGRAVAWRAAGLGMNVLAFEPYPNVEFIEQWGVELAEFDDLLARSDYVSLHLPMSAESRHLMNADTFAKMKPGSVLINTARGALVDEAALYEALTSGHLRAAGLDVFEVEPLPLDSPLLTLDNVLMAGHLAGLDEESHEDTFAMAARTIIELRDGGWPAQCIQNLKGVNGWKW